MEDEEFAAWFRLLEAPGLGRERVRRLLAALGPPQAVLEAPPGVLRDLAGPAAAAAIKTLPAWFEQRWNGARDWRRQDSRHFVLSLADRDYPKPLLDTPDPPLLLYGQGCPTALNAPMLAIVGSRSPTPQGLDNARQFAQHLSNQGWTVVSGLALGIDAAAHQGALLGASASVAVVGTGLDIVYPRRHARLAREIAERGAVLSEFAPGTPALSAHFPQRNRIIAGLARGTLVVEAALASGSLITARLAAEAGREVFAIPGSIHSPLSRGCHALIRQGAKLVESAQDMAEELPLEAGSAATRGPRELPPHRDPQPSGHPLLATLGEDPLTLDELSSRSGQAASSLAAQLMELELLGLVARLPGGRYQRRHRA